MKFGMRMCFYIYTNGLLYCISLCVHIHSNFIDLQGWIKGIRRQKDLSFLDIDDGSDAQKLQVRIVLTISYVMRETLNVIDS